jgi:hypothetical protein
MRRVIVAAALLLACVPVQAAPIKYAFSGVIDTGSAAFLTYPDSFPLALGDRFDGTVTYDTENAGAIGGVTWLFAVGFEISVPGKLAVSQSITSAATTFRYGVDGNEASIYTNGPTQSKLPDGFLDDVYLTFRLPSTHSAGPLPDDPMLDAIGTGQLRLWFLSIDIPPCTPACSGYSSVFGTVTSVTRVPEPATLSLLALGLGIVVLRRRRVR